MIDGGTAVALPPVATMLLAFLVPSLLSLAPPAPAPVVVHAQIIPGAVVFDLDRGEQWTVAIDDDGLATSTIIDRATVRREAAAHAPHLPRTIERIDPSADGTQVIVRGDGRAVAIAVTPA